MLSGESKWLEASSSGLGTLVPAQVADTLRDQKFERFDDFRDVLELNQQGNG
ncbi:hypothetical protein [Pectobacterium aroidearum]|uniref:hypothetical protein n=1 Tax=Pectobacterium aroidearum TaxID=1201031 RepID=UPI0032EAE0A6